MTSSLLIGNARIDIRIEGSTLRLPAKDTFRFIRRSERFVGTIYPRANPGLLITERMMLSRILIGTSCS